MWAVLQVNEKRWFLALAAIFYWLILLSIILFFHPFLSITFYLTLLRSLFLCRFSYSCCVYLRLFAFICVYLYYLCKLICVEFWEIEIQFVVVTFRLHYFPILICAPPLYLLLAWNYNTNRNNIYGNLLWYVRVTLQAVHCWKCKNILK